MAYREQLLVPWWWWPLTIIASGATAYTVSLAFRPFPYWIPALVCAALAALVLFLLSRRRVEVDDDGELHVGGAHIPLSSTSRCAVIGPKEKSAALGRQLDPSAFLSHHAWIPSLVLVVIDDPEDPMPYWIFSSANPEKLVAVIESWQNKRGSAHGGSSG